MSSFHDLLKYEGKEISSLFNKASIEGKGTPQEVADRREIVLKQFLKKYFPFPYRFAKGNINDSFGNRSASIDCILLNPCHPYTTTDDERYSIILADGVDAAIEVKPNLNSDVEIERALIQIISVKKLTRQKTGVSYLPNLLPNITKEYHENSKKIPCVIFATETYSNTELLLEKIVDYYVANKIEQKYQFDLIAINDKYLICNTKKDNFIYFDNMEEGLYILEYGELSFAALLLYLNSFPQCEMRYSEPVLKYYFNEKVRIIAYTNINIRLSTI